MKKEQRNPKSASITLHGGGGMLALRAVLNLDGTATTTVTQRDADKKLSRGMTEQHAAMPAAIAHLAALAKKAEALGWQRKTRAVKPDAFTTLPPAPKGNKK
jgi:hypothetical protein